MSKIKASKAKEYNLNADELEYITTLNDIRTRRFEEDGRVIGAYLKLVCQNRLGYDVADNLQFELDFASEDKRLQVTVVPSQQD